MWPTPWRRAASSSSVVKRSSLGGTFFEPTVMTGITQEMKLAKEETFAPLAPIIRFKDENDVIAMANDTEFGLASYFYSRDMARVWRVAEALESGMVGVNTGLLANEAAPFGGVKQSGSGPGRIEIRHRGFPRNQIRLPQRYLNSEARRYARSGKTCAPEDFGIEHDGDRLMVGRCRFRIDVHVE